MFTPPLTIDNFSIEARLKTVNSGGKNLGFGGGFGYRNNTSILLEVLQLQNLCDKGATTVEKLWETKVWVATLGRFCPHAQSPSHRLGWE